MARIRKYIQGDRIFDIRTVVLQINLGGWFMLRGKPKHPSILLSMTLKTVLSFVQGGHLYIARYNPEYLREQHLPLKPNVRLKMVKKRT